MIWLAICQLRHVYSIQDKIRSFICISALSHELCKQCTAKTVSDRATGSINQIPMDRQAELPVLVIVGL